MSASKKKAAAKKPAGKAKAEKKKAPAKAAAKPAAREAKGRKAEEKARKGEEKAPKAGRPAAEKPGKGASKEKEPKLRRAAPPIDEEVEGEELEAEEPEAAGAEADEGDEVAEDGENITGRSEMKALLDRGREKGFVTFDEVNDALPNDIGADQMDDVMSMFGEHDIEVVDGQVKKLPDKPPEPEPKSDDQEEEKEEEDPGYGKSNDPVRLYLRKMGSVSLLTREGEVEIAKRIEEGEKEILAAVLSSSISTRIILDLGDRLRKGKIRVREIIKEAGDDSQSEREEEEVEEEEVEVAEVAEVAAAEGGEPEQPPIPKEEERKVEHVLKHIDAIRRLERDVAKIKETLITKKLSEGKRKDLRTDIKSIEDKMIEHLEAIQLNKKQIDRIVLTLKGYIKRVEEVERELLECERAVDVPSRDLKRLLAEARGDDGAMKKLAKKLGCRLDELEELDRVVRNGQRKVGKVKEEAGVPIEELRRT